MNETMRAEAAASAGRAAQAVAELLGAEECSRETMQSIILCEMDKLVRALERETCDGRPEA
jgi:hypothetical protein